MRDKEYSWYMLSNAPGFGVKSIHYIYKILKSKNISINELFDMNTDELYKLFPEIGRGKFSKANFSCFSQLDFDDRLYTGFEKLKSENVSIIGLDDERYPKSVLQIMGDNAPPILYCKGYLPLLNQVGVSIVGSRDVGDFEITVTKSISQKLAENGINVISGYAKGVDISAHLGALEANGTTTMILSFGMNYLEIKKELKSFNWGKSALFVTQFSPNEKFSGKNAMTRNKLVCAMSKAIVIIKSGPEKDNSGKMSGTFNAGKSALEMGLPVFVLSPKVFNSPPIGNIELIKMGGREFLNGNDILRLLEKYSQQEFDSTNGIVITDKTKVKKIANKFTEPYQANLFD